MDSRLGDPRCYEFGEFQIDANRRVIEALGTRRRLLLPPRIFDAALYFVRHPGLLLSKERLLAELWPGMVVEENSLSQVISQLRRALGESRRDNRYIVTVPRRGYRFVASVVRVAARAGEHPCEDLTVEVLSLDNRSTLHDDEGLAIGIAESIRHRLARLGGFRLLVPAAPGHLREGARHPDAHFRIEGSLQRTGQRLRITARLIDSSDDTLVWSRLFEHTVDDLFDIEDKVARRVANLVRNRVLRTSHLSA